MLGYNHTQLQFSRYNKHVQPNSDLRPIVSYSSRNDSSN